MIVNIGKRIKVDSGDFCFECDADHPGLVTVRKIGSDMIMNLPGNKEDAQYFIRAYLRCIEEDIEYRKTKCE